MSEKCPKCGIEVEMRHNVENNIFFMVLASMPERIHYRDECLERQLTAMTKRAEKAEGKNRIFMEFVEAIADGGLEIEYVAREEAKQVLHAVAIEGLSLEEIEALNEAAKEQ